MNKRTIQYAIDQDTGLVWSRVGDEVAFPECQYIEAGPNNCFDLRYKLEKDTVLRTLPHANLKWTKKIPVKIKNVHRKFWGMKPVQVIVHAPVQKESKQ